jgi:hypothetical protein
METAQWAFEHAVLAERVLSSKELDAADFCNNHTDPAMNAKAGHAAKGKCSPKPTAATMVPVIMET